VTRERYIFKLALLVACFHSALGQTPTQEPVFSEVPALPSAPPPRPPVQSFGSPIYPAPSSGQTELPLPPSQFAVPASPFTRVPGTGGTPFETLPFMERMLEDPLQWGPFRLFPSINYGVSYSEGMRNFGGGGAGTGDEIIVRHTVTPALVLQSQHVTLSYSPSLTYYSKGPYGDTVNQAASIRTAFGYGDWSFSLSHAYSSGSQVLAETARDTETTSHSSGASASYRVSPRSSLDFSLSRSQSDSAEFNSSTTYSTMNWYNYQITDITRLGIGGGAGFTEAERGSDMTYQQLQGRVMWNPRPKISATVNGGVEFRQFVADTGASDRLNPIMGASASYRPFEQTSIRLSADRSVSASLFADQITENTSVSLGVGQRFLERFQANASASVRQSDYQSSSRLLEVDRSDTIWTYTGSLGTSVFRKGSVSAFYTYSSNNSSAPGFAYGGYTIGANFGYRF
jgi:hypothetical protein